ncbi:MAG: hypothetical protein Q7R48_03750 [bacterium]|nr:hypothetical protein [bacterium]
MIQDWSILIIQALQSLWMGFLSFVPSLIGAIIVFVIGWIVSVAAGKLVTEILKRIKFNQIFEKGNWDEALAKADIKVDTSGFLGAIVKWVLVIVFLTVAVEILGFSEFAGFLKNVLNYLPNVVVASLIFVVTVIVTDITEKIIRVSVEKIKVGYGRTVSAIIKWSIWVFAIIAILSQLKFEAADWVFELVKTAFMGISLALAIAFGLGGKDVAADLLKSARDKFRE